LSPSVVLNIPFDQLQASITMTLKDQLFDGFPISPGLILPWKKPVGELLTIGNPKQEKWKRWQQDRDGYYQEIEHSRMFWNKIEIPGITSILLLQIQFEKPNTPFTTADIYLNDTQQIEKELNAQFGEPYAHRIEVQEREGPYDYIQKQWILTYPDSKIKVKFLLDTGCEVVFSEDD
jgi:hypothetical protein